MGLLAWIKQHTSSSQQGSGKTCTFFVLSDVFVADREGRCYCLVHITDGMLRTGLGSEPGAGCM